MKGKWIWWILAVIIWGWNFYWIGKNIYEAGYSKGYIDGYTNCSDYVIKKFEPLLK